MENSPNVWKTFSTIPLYTYPLYSPVLPIKSISNTDLYFISTCGEFSTCGESFLQLYSNITLYFIFIFIKIIFSLFYFNFFSLSSFLFSLSSFLFSSLCSPKTHGNPYPRQTHGEPRHDKPTASPVTTNPRRAQSRQTHASPVTANPRPAQSRQTHTQPRHGKPMASPAVSR